MKASKGVNASDRDRKSAQSKSKTSEGDVAASKKAQKSAGAAAGAAKGKSAAPATMAIKRPVAAAAADAMSDSSDDAAPKKAKAQKAAASLAAVGAGHAKGKGAVAAAVSAKRKRDEPRTAQSMDVDSDDNNDDDNENESSHGAQSGADDAERVPVKKRKLLDGVAELEHANALWKTQQYRNKQRTLVFASRGITHRARHLQNDLRLLMPHSRKESKMDRKDKLYIANEIAELKAANNCVFFEVRKHEDVFLWVSRVPHGPSAKFHVLNVHTSDELKLTGNALRGSRPVLSFDASFDTVPHLRLLRELFTQVFGTPNRHPKSKPFIDHVLSFSFADDKIWFRNYQMYDQQLDAARDELRMIEIGPRFVLNPIRIFEGSFCGATLWENPKYLSPNQVRLHAKRMASMDFRNRKAAEAKREQKQAATRPAVDELDDVFA